MILTNVVIITLEPHAPKFPIDDKINSKISLWQGDITHLHVDAIVNAANEAMRGGGGGNL